MLKTPLKLFLKKESIPVPYVQMYRESAFLYNKSQQMKGCHAQTNFEHLATLGLFIENSFKVIRPLLNCSRCQITKICQHEYLPLYPDKSNKCVFYTRNRIRTQILPSIKIYINPQTESAIYRLAEHITEDQERISKMLNRI